MKTIELASFVSMFALAAAVAPLTSPLTSPLVSAFVPGLAAQSAQEQKEASARMIAALELHEGSIVAEMGAGSGERTIDIAKAVGATGRVYTTELGDDRLRNLRNAVEKAGLKNVTVLPANATRTNLDDGCCDALYMENVYHHFEDPAAMNVSIFRSLKAGGRLGIVDFAPDNGGESKDPKDRDQNPHHGVKAATVQAELERAGFELVKMDKIKEHGFLLVMRKPGAAARQGSSQ